MCNLLENWRKFEQYGRDALNNTFGECVVAKANEADCLANAEVQTREEGGSFKYNEQPRKLNEGRDTRTRIENIEH